MYKTKISSELYNKQIQLKKLLSSTNSTYTCAPTKTCSKPQKYTERKNKESALLESYACVSVVACTKGIKHSEHSYGISTWLGNSTNIWLRPNKIPVIYIQSAAERGWGNSGCIKSQDYTVM